MKLTDFERTSPIWMRLVEWQTERLDKLRRENDQNLDAVATARLRGRIEEIKVFLRSGDDSDRKVVTDAG